jgi:hypothetical protein
VTGATLRELAASAANGDGSARRQLSAEARGQAREILADDRFHEGRHRGGPLHQAFVTLGDWLEDLVDALPGGALGGWALIGAFAAIVALLATTYVRSRTADRAWGAGPAGATALAAAESPDALERRAAAAEQAGDHALAVRLRFTAGLLRLDRAHAIDLRPSLTSGEIGRALHSSRYDELARTHDAVAYGGRPADATDAEHARQDWPQLIVEAGR